MGRLRRTLQGLQACGTLVIMVMILTGRSATFRREKKAGEGKQDERLHGNKKNQNYYRYLHCDASRAVIPYM